MLLLEQCTRLLRGVFSWEGGNALVKEHEAQGVIGGDKNSEGVGDKKGQ